MVWSVGAAASGRNGAGRACAVVARAHLRTELAINGRNGAGSPVGDVDLTHLHERGEAEHVWRLRGHAAGTSMGARW